MTTAKTIALTKETFVDKVMSLLFNTLSRLVITFLLYQSLCHSLKTNTIKMRSLVDWASKSLQMVIAAMKLKDTYSLEEKL